MQPILKPRLKLKRVEIKNFKNITEKVIPLSRLMEFYGKNRTGKSSILEAIWFVFMGGKKDVDKIKTGEVQSVVKLFCNVTPEEGGADRELEVIHTITRDGKTKRRAFLDKMEIRSPKAWLSNFIGFGTFNPRELLSEEGRTARLLSLLPLEIKQTDLIIPGSIEPFPFMEGSVDFNKHGYHVLKQVQTEMEKDRRSLSQVKTQLTKSYEEYSSEHNKKIHKHIELYKEDPREKTEGFSYEKVVSDIAKEKSLIEQGAKRKEEVEKEINSYKEKMNSQAQELVALKEKISGLETLNSQTKELITNKEKELSEIPKPDFAKQEELNKKLAMYKSKDEILNESKFIGKKKEEAEQAVNKWKTLKDIIYNDWPKFTKSVLKPLTKKIDGLSIADNGEFLYKDAPLNSLSGSEIITLGMELMSLGEKCELLLINEAEALDKDSVGKLNFENFGNVLVARVADEPIGKEFNSVEMK